MWANLWVNGQMFNYMILAAWDLKAFLENATKYAQTVGQVFLVLLGLILIIISGYKIWRNFTSDSQQRQPKWGMTIVGLLVGGALFATGLTLLTDIAKGGTKTIRDMGDGAGGALDFVRFVKDTGAAGVVNFIQFHLPF